MDTIYALSTAAGRAGVAVIRISGPESRAVLAKLVNDVPPPRRASLRLLRHPRTGDALDQGMVLFFPAPHSFTGEDVAEFQVHGGRAVVHGVLDALAEIPGLRPATAGEFTRRAFEQGKLDLTAAEGLADLVNAETEAQRRQALRQLKGELGALYESWRAELLGALARIEALVDFPDEDLPGGLSEHSRIILARVASKIQEHLADNRRGQRLRDGIVVAILGAPNVGKSSLLNALARRPAAIVAAQAGTTRDVIEAALDLAGYPVILCDTAGLRESDEEVEVEGVRRARERGHDADFKILMVTASDYQNIEASLAEFADDNAIFAVNKCDLNAAPDVDRICGRPGYRISALTGAGLDALLAAVTSAVIERAGLSTGPALTRQRHRHALRESRAAIQRALEIDDIELLAEDLRLAVRSIGSITGRVDVEDLLDVIFSEFCIGK